VERGGGKRGLPLLQSVRKNLRGGVGGLFRGKHGFSEIVHINWAFLMFFFFNLKPVFLPENLFLTGKRVF